MALAVCPWIPEVWMSLRYGGIQFFPRAENGRIRWEIGSLSPILEFPFKMVNAFHRIGVTDHKVNATLHNIQSTGLAPQRKKGVRCHTGHTGVTLDPEMVKIGSALSGTLLNMHSHSRP